MGTGSSPVVAVWVLSLGSLSVVALPFAAFDESALIAASDCSSFFECS